MYPRSGWNEVGLQLPPPTQPGKITRSFGPYCAYGVPPIAPPSSANRSLQYFSCSEVTLATSSSLKLIRANGGGFTGNGCVGQFWSPGVGLSLTTSRSSIL